MAGEHNVDLSVLGQPVAQKMDVRFYLAAIFNLLLLATGPSCKIASFNYPDNKGLALPWLYMACIITALLSSSYLEAKIEHHGKTETDELIKRIKGTAGGPTGPDR
ncbi:MAG: hypothetical protein Q7V63_01165 [Gammaproteobacteria bacterium]|nr:hypothetical protein [Gammaproteobacteria bacterium]